VKENLLYQSELQEVEEEEMEDDEVVEEVMEYDEDELID